MKTIPLTHGLVAIVDDEDYEMLSHWSWCAARKRNDTFYAMRANRHCGKVTTVEMHRQILLPGPGQRVDHRNHNPLDNRRENLRLCSNQQNCQNQKIRADNTSGFKGVCFNRVGMSWGATIQVGTRRIFLGYFKTPIEASEAYDEAAVLHFGEFALTNRTMRGAG